MRPRRTRRLALIAASLAAALGAPSAHAAYFAAEPIDGPTNIGAFGDIDVAPDGTGGLAYLKNGDVYVSSLLGGVWSAPVQVDQNANAAFNPRIAAGNGGRLAIVFTDTTLGDQKLIGVTRSGAGQPFTPQDTVLDPAADFGIGDTSIDVNAAGNGYVLFKTGSGSDGDVRAARIAGPQFTVLADPLESPLSAPADTSNGPNLAVGVDAQGNGVGFWTEDPDGTANQTAYVRRISGLTLGAPVQWNVATFQGAPDAGGAQGGIMLDVGVAADGSAWAIGRQDFTSGGFDRARAIARKLTGNAFGPPVAADGLAFPLATPDGGENPEIDVAANGTGLAAANRQLTNNATGGQVTGAGIANVTPLITGSPNTIGAPAVAAGENGTGLVAFHRGTLNDVVTRRHAGTAFESLQPLSNPAFGAAQGFVGGAEHAAASSRGDVAVAFLQGTGADTRLVVAGFDAPPTAPVGTTSEKVTRDATPTLRWTAASDLWGGIESYRVIVDGKQVGTTTGLSFTTPRLSSKGHTWSVQAVDRRGQAAVSATRALKVDATKPKAALRFGGVKRVGKRVKVIVTARDASGIRKITVKFGDRKKRAKTRRIKRRNVFAHRYRKAKRFTVTATVIDKAGNRKTVRKKLRIKP